MQSNPPTLGDFLSYMELGKSYDGNDPEARRLAAGISVFDGEAEALAAVARTAGQYGEAAVETFALFRADDESDDVDCIAAGAELLARARQAGSNGGEAQGQQRVAGLSPTSGA